MLTCKHLHSMSYTNTHNFLITDTDPRQGFSFAAPILFSQIFEGAPQFYPGSVVTVQEILTIVSQIDAGKDHLIDKDLRWFDPKVYYGSYQFSSSVDTSLEPENEGGQGFLTNGIHQIKRYSQYTITANPDTPVAAHNIFTIDNCNFGLVTASLGVPPVVVTVQKPLTDAAVFSGNTSIQRAPLLDTEYNSFFRSVGLYHNPGCKAVLLQKSIAVINNIYTDYANFPNFVCVPLGG